MSKHIIQVGFFLFAIFLVLALAFFIFMPLFTVVFLSIIFCVVFFPVHRKIRTLFRGHKTLSALVSTLLLLAVIIVPLSFVGTLLVREALDLYSTTLAGESRQTVLSTTLESVDTFLSRVTGRDIALSEFVDVSAYSQRALAWVLDHVGGVFSGFVRGVFSIVLVMLSVFYLLRDGEWFVKRVVELSPLENGYDQKILNKLSTAINSVIRGHLIIGVIQGTLVALGLAFFNVPSPVIWGFIAAIASLIPSVGTGLVMVPAIIFVFVTGGVWSAVALTVWGLVVVGFVDNLLGPILIERGIKIHPFIILLSVLGGLQLFGPIGFIAGPVVVALLLALLEIYPLILKPLPEHTNS